ncbi:MAG: hypothetical protein GXP36_12740 [Actinobacteria bacterium]|nr:hypothetical protein [Actinomycetota bacterium]
MDAFILVRDGVPAKVVSERLGHSSIQVTLDTYTHYVRELHDDAAAKVAGLIGLE